jgi:hypothetical protein
LKVKRDQLTGAILILMGIVFGYLTHQFSKPFTAAYPGPKAIPYLAVFGLIVCGLGIFIKGCRQKEEDKVFLVKAGYVRILVTFLVLCAYVFLMKYLGYLIVTPFVVFGLTTYFSKASKIETRLWVRIVFSLVVSFFIWFMYVKLFSMTLPSGLLFD